MYVLSCCCSVRVLCFCHCFYVDDSVIQVCFLTLSLLIATTVNNLSVVLAVVGATGSATVSYILPGFFFYLTFPKGQAPEWKRNAALIQGIVGLLIIPICLTFIFL